MYLAIVIATMLIVVTTLLPFWRNTHYLVRGFDFPRLQLATLAVALLIWQSVSLDFSQQASWVMVGCVIACLAWHLWWIIPYTPLWPIEVKKSEDDSEATRLSLITSNVLTPNRQADKLLNLVRQIKPDVLVTMESDQWWQDQLDVLEAHMPYTIKCPLDNLYGMHVYSRLPLQDCEISYLVEQDVPSMHCMLTLRSGDKVKMHFVHPAPPSPTENEESAERDAELIMVAKAVSKHQLPLVVAGDLNDVAWSSTTRLFRKISGLLDPRVGRGMLNTFHVGYPFLRWPMDHLFHSEHFTVRLIERLPSIGSDHFALHTELSFTPSEKPQQEGLKADDDDQQRAKQIMQEKAVKVSDVPDPQ